MFVGLASTPGGSTRSEASKQGYFSRCRQRHRYMPVFETLSVRADSCNLSCKNAYAHRRRQMP
jgi:hypothetical protein